MFTSSFQMMVIQVISTFQDKERPGKPKSFEDEELPGKQMINFNCTLIEKRP